VLVELVNNIYQSWRGGKSHEHETRQIQDFRARGQVGFRQITNQYFLANDGGTTPGYGVKTALAVICHWVFPGI
jgi:hypothetical protein